MTTQKSPEEIEAMKIVDKWLFAIDNGDITNGEANQLAASFAQALATQSDELAKLKRQLEVALKGLQNSCDCGYYEPGVVCSACTARDQIERIGEGNE